MNNIVNTVLGTLIAIGLSHYCDVPIEKALTVGFVAIIAYALNDISRYLRNRG